MTPKKPHRKVGVFGSAFNPPTLGHLDVIDQAQSLFDEVLLVPSAAHPFAKQMTPFQVRLEMCRQMVAHSRFDCQLTVLDIEEKMRKSAPGRPVYTYELLNQIELDYPDDKLFFIRGPDNAKSETWQKFYRFAEIEKRWSLYTASERMNIRSSKVRDLLRYGKCERDELRALLPEVVIECVIEGGLYRDSS